MIYYKERPRCRKCIEILLKNYNCTLEELLAGKYCIITSGLKIQCKKMIAEQKPEGYPGFHSALDLYKEKEGTK